MDDTPKLWERALNALAAGRWNPSQGLQEVPGGGLPLMISHAQGCRSFDTSGRAYIDYMMGWGTALLGFRHPKVESAILSQLSRGLTPTLMNPIEIEVAEALKRMIPCADKVAFAKSGSDVLALAARIARGYTRRNKILFCGFHGIHDWYMASVKTCPGIPDCLRELVIPFPYNDLEGLNRLLDEHSGSIAAIFMEAAGEILPEQGFLEGVRALATRHGAVLVFDEVVTGFRLARGGAQAYFNVTPDLACFSKVLANGMPLSALVGPGQLDEAVAAIMYGLTFRGEMLSLAAAKATLEIYENEPITDRLWAVGGHLRESLDESARHLGVPIILRGPSPRMSFHIERQKSLNKPTLLTLFTQECLLRGVLHNTHLLPSYAHDEQAVEETCRGFREALEVLARAVHRDSVEGLLHIPPIILWPDEEARQEEQREEDI
jgi:glutamate-1-semialdehyde 2,1-aminomutase